MCKRKTRKELEKGQRERIEKNQVRQPSVSARTHALLLRPDGSLPSSLRMAG